MKSNKLIGCLFLLSLLSACGGRTTDYDATGTFEATEVLVSAEASGRLLCFDVEEGTRLASGEEVGLIDTVQLYLKKLQLQASMKSVESQRPDVNKQIAATRQQIATAQREKKRVENLLKAGAANQKQLDDWDAQVALLERQLAAQMSSLQNSTTRFVSSHSGGTGGRPVGKVPYCFAYQRYCIGEICRSRRTGCRGQATLQGGRCRSYVSSRLYHIRTALAG